MKDPRSLRLKEKETQWAYQMTYSLFLQLNLDTFLQTSTIEPSEENQSRVGPHLVDSL